MNANNLDLIMLHPTCHARNPTLPVSGDQGAVAVRELGRLVIGYGDSQGTHDQPPKVCKDRAGMLPCKSFIRWVGGFVVQLHRGLGGGGSAAKMEWDGW